MTVLIAVVAMAISAPTAAWAHDCLNASRSDTGSRNSTNGNWTYISEEEVVSFIAGVVGVGDPSAIAGDFLAEVEARGLPTSFSIFVGPLLIGANPKTHERVAAYADGSKSSDGKGIDHAENLIPVYADIMFQLVNS